MQVPPSRPWFKFWPEGVPKHIDYPKVPLFKLLRNSAEKYPDRVSLTHEDRRITYKELNILSDKVAVALTDLDIKKGIVTLFLPNIPEYVISYYGTLKAGAIVSPANPLFKEMELEYQLKDTEAETIIVNDPLYPIVRKVQGKTKLRNVIVAGGKRRPGTLLFNDIMMRRSLQPPEIDVNPKEDVAAIQYTGGTTGMPKGAMMSHFNLVSNAIMNAAWFGWTEEEVVLGVLPLYHTWGSCCCMNSPIYVGARVVLISRFDPKKVLEVVERERVTAWYGSATMFIMLVNYPVLAKYDLTSLRHVKAGAMPIPEEVKRKWDRLTGVPLILGYGLTEASPETHNSPPERVKSGTIGIPIIDTDAKIVDVETGTRKLPIGEVGELIVRGPQIMKGYWKREKETREALRDGWLYTGDIAKMDEEGYFYVVDRKKDMIKYKGYSVYPAEVENVLYMHPAVKECLVIGKPDPIAGEVPKAFVVLKEHATTIEEELIEFCGERIAPFKRIREVEFTEELPKTAVGKVLRRVLRDMEYKKWRSGR